MNNIFDTLKNLSEDLMIKSDKAPTKAATLAYEDASQLLLSEINRITQKIQDDEDYKLEQQMKKFDEDHNNYNVIKSRGHIGIPNDVHAHISSFTIGKHSASEVFEKLSDDYKHDVLSHVAADKEMIEQLVAYRHGFDYITHTKGHDGIDSSNNVYEVKNRKFVLKKKRSHLDLVFDRISPATERKLDEGRPTILMNMTDGSKLLVEMKIAFSDKLINLYSNKVKALKYSKTSGFTIPFSDYKDDIIEISYVSPDISKYHIQLQVLNYLIDNYNF